MGQVLIRNLDDALLTDYRHAARDNARSLEAELRDALARARPKIRPSPDDLIALSRQLWALTPESAAIVDSTPCIRATRDER